MFSNANSLRKKFWRPTAAKTLHEAFALLERQRIRSEYVVRLFYALNFFIWMEFVRNFGASLPDIFIARPFWPVFWMTLDTAPWWEVFFVVACVLTSFIAMAWPWQRWLRIVYFVSLFFFTAMVNSDIGGWERLGSSTQVLVLVTFLFCFLPEKNEKRHRRAWKMGFLITLAQITLLSSYIGSGIWRTRAAIWSWWNGQISPIGMDAMSQFIHLFTSNGGTSATLEQTGIFARFLIENKWASGPGMFVGTLLELAAIAILFRPRWYRTYGILLALFHFGFVLAMNLPFNEQFFLVLLLLIAAPLQEERA